LKALIKSAIAAMLLLGLAACNQATSGTDHKTVSKTEKVETKPQTTNNDTSSKTADEQTADQVPVSLVEAVDGDTIKVIYNGKEETVRYLLIDTPEEKKPHTCVQPYAVDAYNRNKELLSSGKLTLEFDHGNKTDKYGRLLAYVFVDGKSVQEQLLKEGYARVAYIYEPTYKYLNEFRKDESQAKNQKLRIWSKAGYATDHGFIGCVNGQSNATSTTTTHSSTGSGSYSTTASHTATRTISYSTASPSSTKDGPSAATVPSTNNGTTEIFANCTELRKKYPNGVPKGHPAYQEKMDRDHDGYACEK
jgi:micrococcal nuclease